MYAHAEVQDLLTNRRVTTDSPKQISGELLICLGRPIEPVVKGDIIQSNAVIANVCEPADMPRNSSQRLVKCLQ